MSVHMCLDCDSPGDGNCSLCHGFGKIAGEGYSLSSRGIDSDSSCASCTGSGLCQKCEGSGEVEVGGEG